MKPDLIMIERFLHEVDKSFPVPLSEKQELHSFAEKLYEKGTLCAKIEDGRIITMVAGYTDNLSDGMAYISIMATVSDARGRGLAGKCVEEFIEICRQKSIGAIHLYAVASNTAAITVYKRAGFEVWRAENESRPDDLHMIYYIG